MGYRTEHERIGEIAVPAVAYWGAQNRSCGGRFPEFGHSPTTRRRSERWRNRRWQRAGLQTLQLVPFALVRGFDFCIDAFFDHCAQEFVGPLVALGRVVAEPGAMGAIGFDGVVGWGRIGGRFVRPRVVQALNRSYRNRIASPRSRPMRHGGERHYRAMDGNRVHDRHRGIGEIAASGVPRRVQHRDQIVPKAMR